MKRTITVLLVTLLSAHAASAQPGGRAAITARVHGTVFDSLDHTPLAGARITFIPLASPGVIPIATTTAANGGFEIALESGRWRAAIQHPRFDSLGVTLPEQQVDVPRAARFSLSFAAPSAREVTLLLCGPQKHVGDVALVGTVRAAATRLKLDSADVHVVWVNLTLGAGRFTRTLDSTAVRTDRNGWYVACGVPPGAQLLAWAARDSATTGALVIKLADGPARLDLVLDAAARSVTSAADFPLDSADVRRFPVPGGTSHYQAIVRDLRDRPVTNARARMLGRPFVLADVQGVVKLDSLSGGSQTLEVQALGYAPERRVVEVRVGYALSDTVLLVSMESVLETVRVTASRGAAGFDMRRKGEVGQFITAADVERENPKNTTSLLRTRDGLRYIDGAGNPYIAIATGFKPCRPLILVDGYPPGQVPMAKGVAALNWMMHSDEIGGVEIYTNPAQVPSQFAIWGNRSCGAIVFWTREKLGLPKAVVTGPP